ncbi:MAG: cation diffusion facilitator family transporter [Candidatus Krumholzibacteriia bacterium]
MIRREVPDHQRRKTAVAWLSVGSNSLLMLLKVVVGVAIGSVAVVSEAIHSGLDLVAASISLFAVRHSGRPADPRHPFGHGKIENISGAIEALLIFLAAGWIVWEAIHKLHHPQPLTAPLWGVAVMGFSALVNTLVSRRLFRVGRATDSMALQADAWHLRTDVWTSLGVTGGLGLIWLGGRLWPGADLHRLDPLAALIVALLIGRAAWRLTLESTRDLLDESLPSTELAWIRDTVGALPHPVQGMHDLRTRKAGARRFIELHLEVDGAITVHASHAIADDLERAVEAQFPGAQALVHVDPFDDRQATTGRRA